MQGENCVNATGKADTFIAVISRSQDAAVAIFGL
jgi:hypothetical protein